MATAGMEQLSGSTVVKKTVDILERAWDGTWATRLLCVALFLDIAMMVHVGHGLWQWSVGDRALSGDVGWIACMLVVFSLAATYIIPLAVTLVRQTLMVIRDSNWFSALTNVFGAQEDQPYRRTLGCAPADVFRDLALRERDAFLYRIYEAHEQKRRSAERAREDVGDLAAAALIALIADYFVTRHIPGSVGLIDAALQGVGAWWPYVVAGSVCYVCFVLRWAWFSDAPPNEIYYPPLDEELRRKEREARERLDREQILGRVRR